MTYVYTDLGEKGVRGNVHTQTDTVTYVYTDLQGTPLVHADAQGNIIARYDYTPYGNPVASLNGAPDGPSYTGHVYDPESGLVYMQQRYYQPDGRFLSPDPVGPAPGNLFSFNRYGYVDNNPLRYTDPTGMYICNGNKKQCAAVSGGLAGIRTARGSLAADSKGRAALGAVLKFYGKAGQDNGVTVNFTTRGGFNGEADLTGKGRVTVTLNLKLMEMTGKNPGTSVAAETASTIAHEGQHGVDEVFFGSNPSNTTEKLVFEKNAYNTQSYVDEGLNKTSPYGLWKSGWSEGATTNRLRNGSVQHDAMNEVYGSACPASAVDLVFPNGL